MKTTTERLVTTGLIAGALLLATNAAFAHCDTVDGPVVSEARMALKEKEITPVLKWIQPEDEAELKTAFTRTLAVRSQGKEARELADQFFFETLVRLHRAGEGAPYTGLKRAGTKVEPGIEAADQALETGQPERLIQAVTDQAAAGIRRRFSDALQKRQHAGHSVEAGREYVAAYVEFVHYVEALRATAAREAHPHKEPGKTSGATTEHRH